MCKDIKQLDTAKRNLTFSITSLKKFTMMLNAIDQLKEFIHDSKYKQVAELLLAFEDLSLQFKKYEKVQQIAEIYQEKDSIVRDLKFQIEEDLKNYGKGRTQLTSEQLQDACMVVEAIGMEFKNQIVKRMCDILLRPYEDVFLQPENCQLEQTERRYSWLWRQLKEFDMNFSGIFPQYWGMHCYIIYEFCSITRLQLTQILESRNQHDVNVLMKALQITIGFENKIAEDMKKKYAVYLEKAQGEEREQDFSIQSLPKFRGSISITFEPYLLPYIEKEERDLRDNIYKSLNHDDSGLDYETKLLNSVLLIKNHLKVLIKRAAEYATTGIMPSIFIVIKKALQQYYEELSAKIIREEKNNNDEGFEEMLCFMVNTAEYCKEMFQTFEEMLKKFMEPHNLDQVNFDSTMDLFTNLLNKGIEALLGYIEAKIDHEFKGIQQISWDKLENVGDTSNYVKITKNILEKHVQRIFNLVNEVYFIFYMNKLVLMINNKFLTSIYKIKKIGENGSKQLQLDIYDLKTNLTNLAKIQKDDRAIQTFTNFVNKSMLKTENILKLFLPYPNEKLLENFKFFFPDGNQLDYERIIQLKGLKKSDVPQFK
eukprot:TRINITY_DN1532_c0_g1_i3.p1 TRINITY_DN1532_c0_g1~~TRINITY_DN1532_c0_g1_i3.p1  ORF type:complete len:676 (-),score=86.16 TRINITY_DN1532_c0_g1_i3:49-1836(-)